MGNSDEIKVILDRLNDVKKALEVSNNKYNELIEVLDILELTSGLPLPNNKKSKMYPQKKILILLRNYLSTLYSLEKYTDRLFEYLDEGIKSYFYEECEDNSFRHEFLIDFRTCTQHNKLVSHGTMLNSYNDSITDDGLIIYKSILLGSFKEWNQKSKEFLNELDEEINLKEIIEDYQEETNILYDKLNKEIIEFYFEKEK